MESENLYYSDRRVKFFWLALTVIDIGLLFLEIVIRKSHTSPVRTFLFGGFLGIFFGLFDRSVFRPKIRICDHFLLSNYDHNAVNWSQVKSVKMRGDLLTLQVPEARFKRTYYVSFSYISDKERLIGDVDKICEAKRIPFQKNPPFERAESVRSVVTLLVFLLFLSFLVGSALNNMMTHEECEDLSCAIANYAAKSGISTEGMTIQWNSDGTATIFFASPSR